MSFDKLVGKCVKRAENRDRFAIEITAMDGSSDWKASGYTTYSLTDLSSYGGNYGDDSSFSMYPYGGESSVQSVVTWYVGQGLYCNLTFSGKGTSPVYKLALQSDYENCDAGSCELVYTDDYVVYVTLTDDASADAVNNPNPTTGVAPIFIDGSNRVESVEGRVAYLGVTEPSRLTVYSISGEVVFDAVVEGDGTVDTVSAPGMYIYKLNNKTGKVAL
jgi:hypothetical protein